VKIRKRDGERGEVDVTFSSATVSAAEHAVAAEALAATMRRAHQDTSSTSAWQDAKQAEREFPIEVALAGAWAQIAQALK
jgi:hypothetical protein